MAHNDVCARARRNTERVFNEINCLNLLMIDCNSCHVGGAAFIPILRNRTASTAIDFPCLNSISRAFLLCIYLVPYAYSR